MRNTQAAVLVAGCLVVTPSAGFAQPSRSGDSLRDATAALHATHGVVKSIGDTTLVVSRPHQRGDITFVLSADTHRAGAIVVGAMVSVRYRDDGKSHIATAVARQRQ
jgi:hypothetical protein